MDGSHRLSLALHEPVEDTGPVVFVAHAQGLCKDAYLPFLGALNRAAAISFDFRNQGQSSAITTAMREALANDPDQVWTWAMDDVVAVASTGEFESCRSTSRCGTLAFGHSLGGSAMLGVVGLGQGIPGLRGLVLFEPIVKLVDTTGEVGRPDNPMSAMTRRRRSRFASAADVIESLGSKPPMMSFDPRALAGYAHGAFRGDGDGVVLTCDPEFESFAYRSRNRILQRCEEQAAPCAVPLLVLVGEKSKHNAHQGYSTVDVYREIARRLGADFKVVRGVGHFGPLEKPDVVADIINEWFVGVTHSKSCL